jgi:cardiolipin synthase
MIALPPLPSFDLLDPVAFAALSITIEILGITAAMEAIMKTRTSPGAIAWALSLVLMPVLVLPLYLVFGRRKFRGYRKARRLGNTPIQRLAGTLQHSVQQYLPASPPPADVTLERIAQMPFTHGNDVKLLIDGDMTFAELFDALREARDYILLEYYIVRDDMLGEQLGELLINKARSGVRVLFLYDEIGSFNLGSDYIDRLREGGVDIRSFHSTKGHRNRFQLNFRNHRKITVVDGGFGMVGGMNIGVEYLGHDPELSPWRDTNLAVRGPAVQCLQLIFLEDWYWACEDIPALTWQPRAGASADDATALVIPTGPADSLETCVLSVLHLIQSARQRLWIVSPYFVPDLAVIQALQLAALRGVDVRILLPEKPDRWLVWLSSFAFLDDVHATGVRVYRYRAGFLHQKVWLIDNDCAMVGSTNLDNRSFRLNFEVNVIARDQRLATQVEGMLVKDFAASRLLQPGEFSDRPWWFRLAVRCAYLLAPVQ